MERGMPGELYIGELPLSNGAGAHQVFTKVVPTSQLWQALDLVVVGSSPIVGVLQTAGNSFAARPHFGARRPRKMDTLGFEPRAFRMRSGCDTTTPCAPHSMVQ